MTPILLELNSGDLSPHSPRRRGRQAAYDDRMPCLSGCGQGDRSDPHRSFDSGSRWADCRATLPLCAIGRAVSRVGAAAAHVRRAADRFQCPEERIEPVAVHGSALASRDRSPTFLLAAVADWVCGAGLYQAEHACRGRGLAQAESVVDPHSIATYWNINRELDSGQGAPANRRA